MNKTVNLPAQQLANLAADFLGLVDVCENRTWPKRDEEQLAREVLAHVRHFQQRIEEMQAEQRRDAAGG